MDIDMKKYYVYETTCTINGNLYVGVHGSDDIDNDPYVGSGIRITNLINKYGRDIFERRILAVFDSECEAFLLEAQLVDDAFLKRNDVLNLSLGGNGGSGPAKCISSESALLRGKKAGDTQRGRTKATHNYLVLAAEKIKRCWKNKSNTEIKAHGQKSSQWMKNDVVKHQQAIEKRVEQLRGRTKENHEGRRRQAEKMSAILNSGLAEQIAQKNRGRTKENHEGRRRQAEKISVIQLGRTKETDAGCMKRSIKMSGPSNPGSGKFGELSPVSKLSNVERLQIISDFESGISRKDLYNKYSYVSAATVKKIIQHRERIKEQLKEIK